jgi:ribose 5-phosphate isomerase
MSEQQNEAKKVAGRRVIEEFVRDGMKLGLGSGTRAWKARGQWHEANLHHDVTLDD